MTKQEFCESRSEKVAGFYSIFLEPWRVGKFIASLGSEMAHKRAVFIGFFGQQSINRKICSILYDPHAL